MAICQSALKLGAKGIEASPFPLGHAAASSRRVWRAIINSSFVRTTQAETLLSRELIRCRDDFFADATPRLPPLRISKRLCHKEGACPLTSISVSRFRVYFDRVAITYSNVRVRRHGFSASLGHRRCVLFTLRISAP